MTLAETVRRNALQGAALWTTLAFYLLLLVLLVGTAMISAYATSWFAAFSSFGWESVPYTTTRIDQLPGWLEGVGRRWQAVRGEPLASMPTQISMALIAGLLFAVGYLGFSRPPGPSLLKDPRTGKGAAQVLADFGYFNDIVASELFDDATAIGRRIVFPQATITRLSDGKPQSPSEAAATRFFMAHEYVHALMRDNLVHSLFRIMFFVVSAFVAVICVIFIVCTVMIATPYLGSAAAYILLCGLITIVVLMAIVTSMHGVMIGYIKVREYFADRAGFDLITSEDDPYRYMRSVPPNPFRRDVSKVERAWHRQGVSLFGRDMMASVVVFYLAARSLILLLVPRLTDYWVLLLDVLAVLALVVLFRFLPPAPPKRCDRPVMPMLVVLLSLVALLLCFPGAVGMLTYYWNVQILTSAEGKLLVWPIVISILVVGWCTVVRILARVMSRRMRIGPVIPSHIGAWLLRLFILPGRVCSVGLLVLLLACGGSLLRVVLDPANNGDWTSGQVAAGACIVAALLAMAAVIYRNTLFFSLRLALVEGVLSAILLFVLLGFMSVIMIVAGDVVTPTAEQGQPDLVTYLQNATADQIAIGGTVAAVFVGLYIIAKVIEYGCRVRINKYLGVGGST